MLLTLIAFLIVLAVLVLVHEWGHFVVARKCGIKVDEFGFGLPPRIIGLQRYREPASASNTEATASRWRWRIIWGTQAYPVGETVYSLNWIPLGGFVKIKGEDGGSVDPDSFGTKSIGARIGVISAGVTMNIILAAVLLSVGLSLGSPQFVDEGTLPAAARVRDPRIMIVNVLPDSPASRATLRTGDVISRIDGQPFDDISFFQSYVSDKVEKPIELTIVRGTETIVREVVPTILAETERGGIGVALAKTATVSYPWYIAWWYGIMTTGTLIWGVILSFVMLLQTLFVSGKLIGDVYGPVGIASLVGDATRLGFLYVLQFTATLSVIIAVINFLPFPALDGGRVVFLLIEKFRGRPVNPRVENMVHTIGFSLLMVLLLVVTFRDLSRYTTVFANWWQAIIGLF